MKVSLNYYSYKPRLKLSVIVDIPEPQINDKIVIPKEWFSEIGKDYKSIYNSLTMIVEGREINCCYYQGPILCVNMKLADDAL